MGHTREVGCHDVLCLGGVCEEIDAGWDTLEKKTDVLWVGSVCEEIDASWDAESKVVWISSNGEK